MPAFQASGGDPLQPALPPTNTRPVRGLSPDDRRFGLLTVRRRRLPARGVPPVGIGPPVFEGCYVDGAVEPTTGARFFLERPYLNAERVQRFVDAVAPAFPDSLHRLLRDHSGAPTAQRLILPATVRLVFVPPSCPERNPIARVWRALKDGRAWLHLPTLEAQQDSLARLLRADETAPLHALTSDTSVVEAIHALDS
jgi:hypothetical protein